MAEMTVSEQVDGHWLRGNAYVGKKDIDNAIVEFKKVLLLDPDCSDARDSLARCINDIALRYSNNGDNANSIAEYSKAIILAKSVDFPKELFSILYFNRGVGYRQAGDYKQAAQDFWEAWRLNPADPSCRNNELAARARSGSKPYRSSIPSSVADYIKRGKEYLQKDAYDNAIEDFNDALVLDPKSAAGYGGRGEAYKYKECYDEAIADCDKAISINHQNPSFYRTRGEAYRGKGDNEKADADFKKAEEWQSIKDKIKKENLVKKAIVTLIGIISTVAWLFIISKSNIHQVAGLLNGAVLGFLIGLCKGLETYNKLWYVFAPILGLIIGIITGTIIGMIGGIFWAIAMFFGCGLVWFAAKKHW